LFDNTGFFMIGVVAAAIWWFVTSVGVGVAARARGQHPAQWFLVSLFVGPVIAALLLLCHPVQVVPGQAVVM
jgi:arginine exporter protein ArgO